MLNSGGKAGLGTADPVQHGEPEATAGTRTGPDTAFTQRRHQGNPPVSTSTAILVGLEMEIPGRTHSRDPAGDQGSYNS